MGISSTVVPALLFATIIAVVGAGFGIAIGRVERRRLDLLIHIAVGVLFGITAFDILPEAKAALPWPAFIAACISGYGLLWIVGHFVYDVCPSCAIAHGDEARSRAKGVSLLLLAVALGLHCVLDGLAISAGGSLSVRAEWGALLAVGLHKLPEGFALGLLLIGSQFSRWKSFAFSVGIEALTILGGLAGIAFVTKPTPTALGAIFAFVGGGFLYLVANSFLGALLHRATVPRRIWIATEAASFLLTGCVVWISGRI